METTGENQSSSAPAGKSPPSDTSAAIAELRREADAAREVLIQRYASRPGGYFRQRSEEEIRRSEAAAAEQRRLAKIVDAKRIAGVPLRYREAALSDLTRLPLDSQAAYSRAIDTVSRVMTRQMIIALIGEIGGGKTHMACAVINAMVQQGRLARYTTAKEYIDAVRGKYGTRSDPAQVEVEFAQPELLVIDELQMRGETDHEDNLLMTLIDKRYRAMRSTILISNHADKQKFMERIDARTADRMMEAGGIFVVDWPSIRGRLQG